MIGLKRVLGLYGTGIDHEIEHQTGLNRVVAERFEGIGILSVTSILTSPTSSPAMGMSPPADEVFEHDSKLGGSNGHRGTPFSSKC